MIEFSIVVGCYARELVARSEKRFRRKIRKETDLSISDLHRDYEVDLHTPVIDA